jgi:hypothetical protein
VSGQRVLAESVWVGIYINKQKKIGEDGKEIPHIHSAVCLTTGP